MSENSNRRQMSSNKCLKFKWELNVWQQMSENSRWHQMSVDECLKIHVKCHLMSDVTCLIIIKCLWRQSSQPVTGLRCPVSKVLATIAIGVKKIESCKNRGKPRTL